MRRYHFGKVLLGAFYQQNQGSDWQIGMVITSVDETKVVASSSVQCCCREAPLAQAWGQDTLIILCNAWNVSLIPVQKDKASKSQS